jgi:hypothetical protein
MKRPFALLIVMLSLVIFLSDQARGYSTYDRKLIPARSARLVPYAPLQDYMHFFMPDQWAAQDVKEGRWSFNAPANACPCLLKAELGIGDAAQTFEEFLLEISGPDSQTRVLGPLGFPDKFDDRRERYFVHFIKEGRMLSAIFGEIADAVHGRRITLSLVFCTDDLDYYDALTLAALCTARLPGSPEVPREILTYGRPVTIYPCTALKVPPGQATPEETISSYYGCLITNRWEKARKYLLPAIDLCPPPATPLFKERTWWTLHWFRLLYLAQYDDRVECSVMKEVMQYEEATQGVDHVPLKMRSPRWFIARIP